MGNTNCRFTINAIGKGGETYYTYCQTKKEVDHWIKEHQDKILTENIRITDKRKNPLLDLLFSRN